MSGINYNYLKNVLIYYIKYNLMEKLIITKIMSYMKINDDTPFYYKSYWYFLFNYCYLLFSYKIFIDDFDTETEIPMDRNSSYPNELDDEYTMKSNNLDINDVESTAELSMVSYNDINNIELVVMKEEEMGIEEDHHLYEEIIMENLDELKNEYVEEIYLDEENNETHTVSPSEIFNCNVCNMDFHSVQDHINEYHQNQTVELQVITYKYII